MVTNNSMSLDTNPVPELSGQQRRCHVLLMLYAPLPAVQLEMISQINGTDLPTTRQDVAEVTREIQRLHHLDILLSGEDACRLQGTLLDQRLCLFDGLRRALRTSPQFIANHFMPWLHQALQPHGVADDSVCQQQLTTLVQQCALQLGREFTERDLEFLHLYLQYCLWQNSAQRDTTFSPIAFDALQVQWLREKPEYLAASHLFSQLQQLSAGKLAEGERDFFTLLLRLLKKHSYHSSGSDEDQRLMRQIEQVVENFQDVAGMKFSSDEGLIRQLFAHLGPAIERCHFAIGIDNLLQDEVTRMYPRLVRTAREALEDFQQEYRIRLSEEEVGLVAVTFGAWLMQGNALQEKQILLLTHNNPQLEEAVEQQIREATLLPLNIKYQTLAEFQQYGAPGGVAMIVTPYATKITDADPLVIHTQLPLVKEQRKRIRSLLEAP
ncbi:stationary phase inducible protein [Enterobacterales bacterium]|nr:stationary phase inducible protein [Enterobacterales bacterium]